MVRVAVIATIIILALMIFGIIDCSRTPENQIRSLPKWAWLVIIIFVPGIGALAWIIAGRPKGTKIMITNQAHFGRLLIRPSSVREQSIIEKIINAVTMIAAITAARIMSEV